jgi:hypothetical protein
LREREREREREGEGGCAGRCNFFGSILGKQG